MGAANARLWPWAFSLLCLGNACGALDDFEEVIEDRATIPGSFMSQAPFALNYEGGFKGLQLSQGKNFANQGVSPSDVDAIFVKSITIEGTDPQKDRLDVLLESVEIYVEAPGQTRTKLGTRSGFAMGAMSALELTPDLNLNPFAVAESMTVSAEVKLKQQPTFDTTLRTVITLLIDINLLGI